MESASLELPRYIALKSMHNKSYLRYVHEDGPIHGFLEFSGEEAMSPYAKYEVEKAKCGNGFVNIRCCYNNKYWASASSQRYWIAANADKPEEDESVWSCTLFKPVVVGGYPSAVRFFHVKDGRYVSLVEADEPYSQCFYADSAIPNEDMQDVCVITDWEIATAMALASKELPRYITVKSKYNENYLQFIHEDGPIHGFLEFSSEEATSPYAKYEVEKAKCGNGLVNIRCCYNNKYWVREKSSSYWIVANADEPEEDQSKWSCTLFKPIAIDGDATAVRFFQVEDGSYACLWQATEPYGKCFYAQSAIPNENMQDVCVVTDWESLVVLPKRTEIATAMALASKELPRYITVKSKYNESYLRYVHEDGPIHGYLEFSGEEVVSPYAKYEVEKAKCGNGLVNIRCCYNNKYWVSANNKSYCIAANADKPEEDQSKWSCTLFKPVAVGGYPSAVRFFHVKDGRYACLWQADEPYSKCFYAQSAIPKRTMEDVFVFTNWETLVILPKHIAFKGDNGKYLNAVYDSHEYLKFSSDDIGDSGVGNEIIVMKDGSIRIKNDHWKKFWRLSPSWIWADSTDTTTQNYLDTMFKPVKVDKNVIALRNLGNSKFCKRFSADGIESCLNAAGATISKDARLEVVELALSRDIYNVSYRLTDGRIYNQTPLVMATGDATNRTNKPNTIDVKLNYTETKSSSWKSSLSLTLGVKTTIETGIPKIADGKIEISAEFTGAYEWGTEDTSSSTLETVYQVTVPPMSMVKVSLLATKGTCEVPFSYTRRDTFTNGDQTTMTMHDGVYTGIGSYNFTYTAEEKDL